MTSIRFLLDEHIPPRLQAALRRLNASIDVRHFGEEGAPPLGTSDPAILQFVAESRQLLISQDYHTIPGHAADHLQSGGQHWGILLVRPGVGVGEVAAALHEVWACTTAEEWQNQVDWIPL